MTAEIKTQRKVDLPSLNLIWLAKAYPGFPLSACLTMLLQNFQRIHEDIGATPNKIARDAAKELKEAIDEGLIDGIEFTGES